MAHRTTSFVTFTTAAILAGSITVTPQGRPIAITAVNIVDVDNGRIIPNSTVTIEGTRIASITQRGSSRDARVVDGHGAFMIPGLWDMHAHTEAAGESALQLHIANGVTGIREMGSDPDGIFRVA